MIPKKRNRRATTEDLDKIKKWWLSGKTGKWIADQMGWTRDAVISKTRSFPRGGEPENSRPMPPRQGNDFRTSNAEHMSLALAKKRAQGLPERQTVFTVGPPVSMEIPFLETQYGQCRYMDNGTCCGHAVVYRNYCQYHTELCYIERLK